MLAVNLRLKWLVHFKIWYKCMLSKVYTFVLRWCMLSVYLKVSLNICFNYLQCKLLLWQSDNYSVNSVWNSLVLLCKFSVY